jgi:hypothetical protein
MKNIVILVAVICIFHVGYPQQSTSITDNTFNVFLSKFKDIKPPLNYRKLKDNSLMTKEEAIKFLQKTEKDLYDIEIDYNYDTDEKTEYRVEKTAGCDFKYKLNDSIYILCTREHIVLTDTAIVYLNSFSLSGNRINKCIVGEKFTFENDYISFVLLDKYNIRVFYYAADWTRKNDGYFSSVYYVDYEITGDGHFIKKHQSNTIYLKKDIGYYAYPFQPDDPMNKYDF